MRANVCARAPVVSASGLGQGEAPQEQVATGDEDGCEGVWSAQLGKRGAL